jgi:tRNA(fMet)-specific endonuclease VapC
VKFLLATDTFSVAVRDASPALRERLSTVTVGELALSVISLGELEYGLARNRPAAPIAARVAALRSALAVLPLAESAVHHYGLLRDALRRKGTPIGPNDCWIAAHALAQGLTLVTGNAREFSRVPGLRVENWMR